MKNRNARKVAPWLRVDFCFLRCHSVVQPTMIQWAQISTAKCVMHDRQKCMCKSHALVAIYVKRSLREVGK